ncbi:MAG: N-6 DNA methylase [Firmicutes bacterium]|nr:N-6 DNA methylase [Bacillota bacterium]
MKTNTGKAAVILPHGVLFRGNTEGDIRKALIDSGIIKGIIGLPANLFYGTGIPACIIVLDKENMAARTGIFMIDASRGFAKDGNKNRLRERDIYKIVKHFNGQINEDKYSRFVPFDEIKTKNGYNLNIPRYIDGSEPEDIQNIDGHLCGGIPALDVDALDKYWQLFKGLKEKLFAPLRVGFYQLNMDKDAVRQSVYADEEFSAYADKVDAAFKAWQDYARAKLLAVTTKTKAKDLIAELSEKLINEYKDITLIDKHDVYEVLLSYWQEVMADDLYLIIKDGYAAAREVDVEIERKMTTNKKTGEEKTTEREKGWDGKIIPKRIIAKAFFAQEVDAVAEAEAIVEATEGKLADLVEEHSGDEGALKDKTVNEARADIKPAKRKETDEEELAILIEFVSLSDLLKEKKALIRDMTKLLWDKVRARYASLTDEEIKELVLTRKWFATVYDGIDALYTAISNRIANRIATLAERYDETLPIIEDRAAELEGKVNAISSSVA